MKNLSPRTKASLTMVCIFGLLVLMCIFPIVQFIIVGLIVIAVGLTLLACVWWGLVCLYEELSH